MAASLAGEGIDALVDTASAPVNGIDPEEILEAVESIMTSIDGDLSSVNLKLFAEIESLARFINTAKTEISALRPDEIKDEHLPTATDQLEAIVGATESATNTIFEAVETIEELAQSMDEETAEKINAAVTSVYEACGFQDLTGQRISRVVTALQHIDAKVGALVEAFGDDFGGVPRPPREESDLKIDGTKKRPDEHLIHGPQKPGEGNSQEDIDALLASFD